METIMNLRRILCVSLVSANLAQAAFGQSFVNLNFEDATVSPTPINTPGGDVDPASAFPGWTVGNSLNGRLYVLYNLSTIGAPSVDLDGPNFPNYDRRAPLQGSFSAHLEYYDAPSMGLPTLSQTGLVPADAQSINFLVGSIVPNERDGVMIVNGVTIPLVPISGGRFAADISSFAGQVVQLTFTTATTDPNRNNLFYFDDIQFSASPVPEPASFVLLGIGAAGLLSLRKRLNLAARF